MTEYMEAYPPWSHSRTNKPLPPLPPKIAAKSSSPIQIPRRKPTLPPPCSPTRDQHSPDLVFNFDFSVSPEVSNDTCHLPLQQRGSTVRRFPLTQKTTFAPFAELGINRPPAHPYAHEPFLYTLPKVPLRKHDDLCESNHTDRDILDVVQGESKALPVSEATSHKVPSVESSISSLSSFQFSEPSCPPSADVSMHVDGGDENHPLTSAFRRPLISASITSSSISSLQDASFSPSMLYRSPSPSPPRKPRSRTQPLVQARPTALHRTSAAAPVVSLNVAQAERSDRGLPAGERSSSPCIGVGYCRPRRSSSVGAKHDVEKLQDPGRRMATVVGRGAGRIVSMFEYHYGGGRSLVSDEDIERSLDKDSEPDGVANAARGRSPSRRRNEELREKAGGRGIGSPELERGRVRGRASVRGSGAATRTRALPGWQWQDAQ